MNNKNNNTYSLINSREKEVKPTHCVIIEALTKKLKTKRMIILFDEKDLWDGCDNAFQQGESIAACINKKQLERIGVNDSLGHKIKICSISSDNGIKTVLEFEPKHYSTTSN